MNAEAPMSGDAPETVAPSSELTLDKLQLALQSADVEVRRQAVERAASSAGLDFDLLLVDALGDVDWRVRTEAVRALWAHEAEPMVFSRLADVLLEETDVGFRNAAVEALGGGGDATVRALSARLERLDADGRKLAADALARTSVQSAIAPLSVLAADADPNVCAAAIEAVARVARYEPERAMPLIERALRHEERFVRLVCLDAAHALELKLPWSVLVQHLADPALTLTALELAATMDEPAAAPYFVQHLGQVTGKAWLSTLGALRLFARRNAQNDAAARAALERLDVATASAVAKAADPSALCGADALIVLCLHGGVVALDRLEAWLGLDAHWDVVSEAVRVLGAPLVPRLLAKLRSGEEDIQVHALELLVQLGDDDALREPILAGARAVASRFTPPVLRVWFGAIARWGNDADFREVFAHWQGTPGPVLRRALVVATEACTRRAEAAARALVAGIDPGSLAVAGVTVVIGASTEPVTGSEASDREFLIRALSHTSSTVRVHALEAMSKLPRLASEDALAFALADDAPEVQHAAVRAAGVLSAAGVEWARDCLFQLVSSSAHVQLAVAALQALSGSRDPLLLTQMGVLLSHRDGWRAAAAVGALRGYPLADRLPALRQALVHPEPGVVKSAVELLAPDENTLADLQECLSHPVWDVRRAAADQLGSGPIEVSTVALTRRLQEEREPLVVEAIYRSLSQLAGNRPLTWRIRQTTPEPG